MAKYQLGAQGHYNNDKGIMYTPNSVQTFPDDYDPSLQWTPLDKAAEAALKRLVERKTKAAKEAFEAREKLPGVPKFEHKPLQAKPTPPPEPENRPDPNTMSALARGQGTRYSDQDV